MKLEQSFEVDAPIDQVWEALIDLERVAPCLPGAAITGHDEDGTYHGEFKVKLGPTTASYRGTVKIEEMDEGAHRATMRAKGTDKRGQGGAQASIVNSLVDLGGRTRVDAVTDYTITGRLASFGRGGMIQDISNRLLGDFSSCLQAELAPPAQPVSVPEASAQEGSMADASAVPSGASAGETGAGAPMPPPAPRPAAQPSKPINGFALVLGVLRTRLADLLEALAKRLRG